MDLLTGIGFTLRIVLFTIAVFPSSHAVAVEARVYQLENGGSIAPHLRIELGLDNNPLRADEGSEGSAFVTVEPTVQYTLQRRNNTLTIGYQGEYLQYFDDFCSEPVRTFGLANTVERPGDCSSSASPTFDKASFQITFLGYPDFWNSTGAPELRLMHQLL